MIPLLFEGKSEGWADLQGEPRFSTYLFEYLARRDFPEAYPWKEQSRRWQRMMLIISGIFRTHELLFEAARATQHSCPFAGMSQ